MWVRSAAAGAAAAAGAGVEALGSMPAALSALLYLERSLEVVDARLAYIVGRHAVSNLNVIWLWNYLQPQEQGPQRRLARRWRQWQLGLRLVCQQL